MLSHASLTLTLTLVLVLVLVSRLPLHRNQSPPPHINTTAAATQQTSVHQLAIMSNNNKSSAFARSTSNGEPSYFETQRAALLGEIGVVGHPLHISSDTVSIYIRCTTLTNPPVPRTHSLGNQQAQPQSRGRHRRWQRVRQR